MSKNTGHKHIDRAMVFVVDDDDALSDSIACLLESANLPCKLFADANAFLEFCTPQHLGCILLDVRMPGMGGLELQDTLKANGIVLPVIVITGHGDVPLAVRAMKSGAFDFLQKPFNAEALLERVHAALEQFEGCRRKNLKRDSLRSHFDALSEREREIMEFVVAGDSSKVIGMKLGISSRTVDIHRSNIMKKLNVPTIADLVRKRMALEDDQADPA
ncbi:MAG TPA: response regulator [Gallionella sp.]|nr:response regulator [Gallionella sp.]